VTRLIDTLRRQPERASSSLSLQQFVDYFQYGGNWYPYGLMKSTLPGTKREEIPGDFEGLARLAYRANGIVFACILARMMVFSEARLTYRRLVNGRPGELFGTQALAVVEQPEPGRTTGDMLARAELDASLAGNWYATNRYPGRIKRLRPDWVSIVLGSYDDPGVTGWDIAAEVIGYMYHPGGIWSGEEPVALLADEVAHYAPIPDPDASYRGMSWLTPIIDEIQADQAATDHKRALFENGATPNMIVSLQEPDPERFQAWADKFKEQHEGVGNAYKTVFLGAGADAKVVGANLEELDFRSVQGGGETRIAAASGVPPIIAGFSEGLEASTYSNYAQARRRFADGTVRPLWRNFAGSLQRIVPTPSGSQLWYDPRDVSFLQEDEKDAAEILAVQAQAVRQLVDAGFEAQSVIAAVDSGDLSRLTHTGLFSVQLQPAGAQQPQPSPDLATSNGRS
jgi:hypothetical protein